MAAACGRGDRGRVIAPQLTFDRVVVGVDGSAESVEACRQAVRLVGPHGLLELASVYNSAPAVRTGWNSPRVREELEVSAQAALSLGRRVAGEVGQTALINGVPAQALLRELRRLDATLAVVGACGHSRLSQMILGGVASELLERAPCSVLVARPPSSGQFFPREIVVGVDDSRPSERAFAIARLLERRFRSSLRILADSRGKSLALGTELPAVERVDDFEAALLVAAANSDLLIAAHRERRGLESLTSVSGRLAHRAASSVLLVR